MAKTLYVKWSYQFDDSKPAGWQLTGPTVKINGVDTYRDPWLLAYDPGETWVSNDPNNTGYDYGERTVATATFDKPDPAELSSKFYIHNTSFNYWTQVSVQDGFVIPLEYDKGLLGAGWQASHDRYEALSGLFTWSTTGTIVYQGAIWTRDTARDLWVEGLDLAQDQLGSWGASKLGVESTYDAIMRVGEVSTALSTLHADGAQTLMSLTDGFSSGTMSSAQADALINSFMSGAQADLNAALREVAGTGTGDGAATLVQAMRYAHRVAIDPETGKMIQSRLEVQNGLEADYSPDYASTRLSPSDIHYSKTVDIVLDGSESSYINTVDHRLDRPASEALRLKGSRDFVGGGGGNDYIRTGGGNDVVNGGSGNDTLHSEYDHDYLNGGSGNDKLIGGQGTDTMIGGTGYDTVYYSGFSPLRDPNISLPEAPQSVEVDLYTGQAFVLVDFVIVEMDTLRSVENVVGASWKDIIKGTSSGNQLKGLGGDDSLYGRGGADLLQGNDGNDSLRGEDGNDTIIGGLGTDYLLGGSGSDRFQFKSQSDSRTGAMDTIASFQRGYDKIDLSRIDADQDDSTATNQAFKWVGSRAFTGTDGELRFASGYVYGDTNGDKIADLKIKVVTIGLSSTDIIL